MIVLLLLILALILFGVGFVVKWVFIGALIALALALFAHLSRN